MFCRIPNSFRGSSLLPGPRRVSFPRLESVLAIVISTQDACSSRLSSLVSGLLCRPHELTRTVTSPFAFINAVEAPPRRIPARSVFGVILRRFVFRLSRRSASCSTKVQREKALGAGREDNKA